MSTQTLTELSQYLTFRLVDETFAIDIGQVQSVLDFEKVTKVPQTPDFMRGVINLRGSVVPIVDLKLKFGLGVTEKTVDSCIIIVEILLDGEITIVGALADSVKEVIDMEQDQIEPPPKLGTSINTDFINGMGKQDDTFVMILNLNKIFSEEELAAVQAAGDIIDKEEEAREKIAEDVSRQNVSAAKTKDKSQKTKSKDKKKKK